MSFVTMSDNELAMIVNVAAANIMAAATAGIHDGVASRAGMSVALARQELERRLGVAGADNLCDAYRTRGVGYAFVRRTG